jgi:hypothetical protein
MATTSEDRRLELGRGSTSIAVSEYRVATVVIGLVTLLADRFG